MEFDESKVDGAVLPLLYVSLHEGDRAWKSLDWTAMNRLNERGLISNPVGKARSVRFTTEGLERAREAAEKAFGKRG